MHVHRQVLAAAERPAHTGEGEPHLLGGEPERLLHLPLVDVQPLRGDVQVDPAVLAGHREPGLGAEERLVLHPDLDLDRRRHGGGRAGVAAAHLQVPDQVLPVGRSPG